MLPPLQEAAAEKERFLASLPKLKAFLDQVVEDCRRTGEGRWLDQGAVHGQMPDCIHDQQMLVFALKVCPTCGTVLYSCAALPVRSNECQLPSGYVEMLSGRRRWLPGINSPQWEVKGRAERAAVNTVVQVGPACTSVSAMQWRRECRIRPELRGNELQCLYNSSVAPNGPHPPGKLPSQPTFLSMPHTQTHAGLRR